MAAFRPGYTAPINAPVMAIFAASMPQEIVPDWYLTVTGIALAGSIVGALYPGLRAARQDAIEALAYD